MHNHSAILIAAPVIVAFVLLFALDVFHYPIITITGVVIISIIANALMFVYRRQRRHERRRRTGRCLECGYDLTGVVAGRCPECGRPFPSQETTS